MTARRQRMIEGLQLRGVSARTQELDVRAVRQLAEHARQSPDVSTAEALRPVVPVPQACQAVRSERQHDRTVRPHVLLRVHPPPRLDDPQLCARPAREQTAGALEPRSGSNDCSAVSACWATESASPPSTPVVCACRRAPLCQVRNLESARRLIHVRHGTGRERSRMAPGHTARWPGCAHTGSPIAIPCVIFPAPGRGGISRSTATAPRPRSRVQGAFREALNASGLHTHASVHTRRHAWAHPWAGGWRQAPAHAGVSRAPRSHHHAASTRT